MINNCGPVLKSLKSNDPPPVHDGSPTDDADRHTDAVDDAAVGTEPAHPVCKPRVLFVLSVCV
jgi:hypothetical protein